MDWGALVLCPCLLTVGAEALKLGCSTHHHSTELPWQGQQKLGVEAPLCRVHHCACPRTPEKSAKEESTW